MKLAILVAVAGFCVFVAASGSAQTPPDAPPESPPEDNVPDPDVPVDDVPEPMLPDDEVPDPMVPDGETPDPEVPGDEVPDPELPGDEVPDAELPDDEVESITSDDLYEIFKVEFEAAGGASNFQIGVGPTRGLTPPSGVACLADLDLIAGTVDVQCEGLTADADVYLVDNQPVEGDSALPESHDVITPIGLIAAGADGPAHIGADLGPGAFADAEVDLVVLVEAEADPTAPGSLIALGGPSAFMRQFWRDTRDGEPVPTTQALSASSAEAVRGRDRGTRRAERRRGQDQGEDPRVRLGLADASMLRGADVFFRETFDGNGRTCETCHRPEANLGLDPKFVRKLRRQELNRFGGLKDPLFVAHPNFIGEHPVPLLEVPFLLNREAMIRENIDDFEAPAEKFVMRGVPHALSLAPTITPPEPRIDGELPDGSMLDFEQRTGWSGDGAPQPGTLRMFTVGAAIQHFRREFDNISPAAGNFRLPNDDELDATERFMLTTGRVRDIQVDAIVLSNAEAEGGRGAFATGACGLCHANAGANARADLPAVDLEGSEDDDLGNRNFNTQVERLDTAARQLFMERTGSPLTCDGGFAGQGLGIDGFNFDSDCGAGSDTGGEGDGADNPDAFGDGKFNTVSVIEAADTGPFFHNHGADTMEEAVAFYRTPAFNESPAALRLQVDLLDIPDVAVTNIAAFLRTLNAGFNLRIAQQRCGAAAQIVRDAIQNSGREDRTTRRLVNRLIALSSEELKDARKVLRRNDAEIDDAPLDLDPLYPDVRRDIRRIIASNNALLSTRNSGDRRVLAASCRADARAARESLTSDESEEVLNFRVGAGNLMF